MRIKMMLDKLKDILNAERHKQLAKYDSLKKVLKSLRVEKKILEQQRSETADEETLDQINSRLKVISVQRKKGLAVLKELKEERTRLKKSEGSSKRKKSH